MEKQYKIGDKVYPIDNSYCICLETGEKSYLAGKGNEPSNLVEIVSEPYKAFKTGFGGSYENEFVKVRFNNKEYEVINCFSEKQPYIENEEQWD